jgi:hypothetical protein
MIMLLTRIKPPRNIDACWNTKTSAAHEAAQHERNDMNAKFVGLEKQAKEAIEQYNKDVAAGGEPPFPDWARDLLALLESHQKLARLAVTFGDTISDMFEQMIKGQWTDSAGHRAEMNQSMIALKAPMLTAIAMQLNMGAA